VSWRRLDPALMLACDAASQFPTQIGDMADYSTESEARMDSGFDRCWLMQLVIGGRGLPVLVATGAALVACDATAPRTDLADVWQARSWVYVSRENPSLSTPFVSYPCGWVVVCSKFWLSIAEGQYELGAVIPAHDDVGGSVDVTPLVWERGRVTVTGRQVTFLSDHPEPGSEPSVNGLVGDPQGDLLVLRGEARLGMADVAISWFRCSDRHRMGEPGQIGAWCN